MSRRVEVEGMMTPPGWHHSIRTRRNLGEGVFIQYTAEGKAIVEMDDGSVDVVEVRFIKFLDKAPAEPPVA